MDSVQFDDAVNIQFTSGTTGAPKGATLTHHNILNNALFVALGYEASAGRPVVRARASLPLLRDGHVKPRLRHTRRNQRAAVRVVQTPSQLSGVWRRTLTHIHGVPTMFVAELAHPEFPRFDVSSLRGAAIERFLRCCRFSRAPAPYFPGDVFLLLVPAGRALTTDLRPIESRLRCKASRIFTTGARRGAATSVIALPSSFAAINASSFSR